MDAGDALGIVSAKNELLHDLCDALDSESAVDDRVLVFVLIGDTLKMTRHRSLYRTSRSWDNPRLFPDSGLTPPVPRCTSA